MKKLCIAAVLGIAMISFLFTPYPARAEDLGKTFWTTPGYWGPLLSCTGNYLPDKALPGRIGVTKACTSMCDMLETLQRILYFGLTILLFVLTPVMILIGGILILVAGGSPSLLKKGKDTAIGALIAAAIGLGSFAIINTFIFVIGAKSDFGLDKGNISWSSISCTPGAGIQLAPSSPADTGPTLPGACQKEHQKLTSSGCVDIPPCAGAADGWCETGKTCKKTGNIYSCAPAGT